MTKTSARILFELMWGYLARYAHRRGVRVVTYQFDRTVAEQREKVQQRLSQTMDSRHVDWLAKDVFIVGDDGNPVWSHTIGDEYEALGLYWERLGKAFARRYGMPGAELTRWGGRFGRNDDTGKAGWDAGHFEVSKAYRNVPYGP